MAQYIGSLEITKREARLIVFESSFRTSSIASQVVVPAEDLDVAEIWQAINEKIDYRLDSLVVNADASSVSTHFLSFPFKDSKKIESAIDFELENQAPYQLEDMSMTWLPVHSAAKTSNILSAMAVKVDLQEQIADLKSAECEPHAVVMPAASLAELIAVEEQGEPVGILSFDDEESHFSLCHEGLLFARTLRIGGDYVDRLVADRCGVSVPEADTLRRKLPTGFLLSEIDSLSEDEKVLFSAIQEGLKPMVQAILMTCTAVSEEEAPKRLVLTGRQAAFPGICAYLQAEIGIPVERLNLDSSLGESVECAEGIENSYAVSLAMGLGFLRQGARTPLNFRRGDLAYAGNVELYQGQILRLALGLSLVFLLALGGAFVRYSLVKAEEENLDQKFCQVTKDIIGKEICDPKRALSILKQSPSEDGEFFIPKYFASTLFEMLSKALPNEIDVTFENVEFRIDRGRGEGDRITGKGEGASFDTIEQMVAAIKKDKCVNNVEISKQRKTKKTGRVQFHFSINVKCADESIPGEKLAAVTKSAVEGGGE